jgi:hypothetical protein
MTNLRKTEPKQAQRSVATIGIMVRHTPTHTPTLGDVAAEAQVHIGTASRALNESTRDMVKPETARRVHEAASRLGYSPNVLAGSLRSQKTASIGVVLPDLTNPFLPPIVRGIEDVLTKRGYVALIGNTDNDAALEQKLVESLRARRVDGFIIATSRRNHPILDKIAKSGTPIVLINRTADRDDISAVISNDALGIRAAVSHLVELGHISSTLPDLQTYPPGATAQKPSKRQCTKTNYPRTRPIFFFASNTPYPRGTQRLNRSLPRART